jgi:hypothetical protein
MLWTLVVGNLLYAASVYGLWLFVGGDTAKFQPALLFATIAFAGGIATGIVANQPAKQKRKTRGRRSSTSAPSSFEITE